MTTAKAGYQSANAAKGETKTNDSKLSDQLHYCWTHGATRNKDHTSKTCSRPAEGHKTEATLFNMMGGNNSIQRQRGERAVFKRKPRENAPANNQSTE